jgi:glycosyltransferase involved in cell wall biosynthesis
MKKFRSARRQSGDSTDGFTGERFSSPTVTHLTSRYPPDLGGMERVVKELTEALAVELHAPVSVVTGTRHGTPGVSRAEDVVVHRLRAFDVMVTPVIPGLAWHLLRAPRPSLLHVHVAHAGTPEVGALVARLRGIPFVAHVHIDAAPTTWMGTLLAPYQKYVLSRVFRQAAAVVVPTESYRALLIEKYRLDPDRVRVLANGTHMPPRYVEAQPASDLSVRPVRLASIGRIAKEKNLELLIDAVANLVSHEHLDVELEIVGNGPMEDQIAKYVRDRGLESRVRLVGLREGDELIEAFDRADIVMMTSLADSFGMVLVEAMARGVPVIAPNITGVRDVVVDGTTGLLVEHTVQSVSDAVLRIVREPGLREHLIAGAHAQRVRYEWPQIARECALLYREVLQESTATASARG